MARFFADRKEFRLIESMFEKARFSKSAHGLGDDGYLFESRGKIWAVTSDISLEGVHYKLNWSTIEQALEKAVLSNLSDINAMGGQGTRLFFNLAARSSWDASAYRRIRKTLAKMKKLHGPEICGGDLTAGGKTSFFSFTAMGEIKGRPLLRSNSKPGHGIYVSGELGSSHLGLRLLQKSGNLLLKKPALPAVRKNRIKKHLISRYLVPGVPLALGPVLSNMKKRIAAIDISDGLSSELWHLSRQSGCRFVIDPEQLPAGPELKEVFLPKACSDAVLHGGEDYQLLFTGAFSRAELQRLNKNAKISLIGEVMTGKGVFTRENNGKLKPLKPNGWTNLK